MKSAEEHVPLREAADVLGISEVQARRWVKTGKLKAYQPGRKYLIPVSAIEELLETPPKKAEASPDQESPERRDSEDVWRAEYLARTDEMLSKCEGELEEKMALAETDPVRFFDWLQQVREFGNPLIMGVVSGFEGTTNHRLEAVLGGAEYVGAWGNLWRRIEERVNQINQPTNQPTKWTEEDDKRFREECAKVYAAR